MAKEVAKSVMRKLKKLPKTKIVGVYPLTVYRCGAHFYTNDDYQADLEESGDFTRPDDEIRIRGNRALGNHFRGAIFLLDRLPKDLPLGSAIRVTVEVVPATEENKKACAVEERDKLR